MAKDKALELSIRIAGNVDKSLINAIGYTQNSISSLSRNLSKVGTVGLAAMGAFAAGTVAAIVDCTNVAEEFETDMSDVVKYVSGLADATGKISDETAENGRTFAENYSDAKKAILDLSTEIPYTAEELTKLAAAAGQSGYAMDDLFSRDENGSVQGFLRDVAMWGTAMDIDAEQAGDWAAKWEEAFGMTHDQVMDMADVINYLGANSATTAAEIAQVVNESVSMGDMAGVDPKTTVAIADAMLAMGVNASSAGTSIKRMYTNLTKGYAASGTIQNAFAKLGMDAEDVAVAMQTDGTQTILDILKGIKELPESEQLATVSSLFGQWAVEGGGKLAENIELLEWAIKAANDPSLYDGSMAREFVIKAGTAESIDQMMSSSWYALREEIGEEFLPVKREFSAMLIDIINGLRDNMPQLEQIAESMASILSGAVSKLGEAFENALPYIQQGLDYVANNGDKVASIIGGLATAFTAMKAAPLIESVARGGGGLISGALGLISSARGKISTTAEYASLGAGLANSSLTAQAINSQATTGIRGKLAGASNSMLGAIFGLKNQKSLIGNGNLTDKTYFARLMDTANQITNAKENGGLLGVITSALSNSSAGKYASGIGSALSGVKGAAGGLASGGLGALGSFGGSILNVGTTVLGPVTSMFAGIMSGALPIVGVIGSIIAVLSILYDNLDSVRDIVGDVFGEPGLAVFDRFRAKLDNVIGYVDNILNNNGLAGALSGVREKLVGGTAEDGSLIQGIFGGETATLVGGTFDGAVSIVQSILSVAGQLVTFANGSLKPIIIDIFNYLTGTVLPIVLQTFISAAPIISQIITNIGTAVMAGAQAIAQAIQTALPFIEGIITTILTIGSVAIPVALAGFNALWAGLSAIVQSIQQVFEGLITFISGAFTGNWSQAWEGVKQIFSSAFEALVELCKAPINAVIALINTAISGINKLGITIPDWVPEIGGKSFGINIPEIPMLAGGGFTSGPSIAGEAGQEAVISFQRGVRSQNIDTWARAGQMLGIDGLYRTSGAELKSIDTRGSSGGGNITISMPVTIQGNADEQVVDRMVSQMQEMFEQLMDKYTRQRERVAFR